MARSRELSPEDMEREVAVFWTRTKLIGVRRSSSETGSAAPDRIASCQGIHR
jgi:hypothetical protein